MLSGILKLVLCVTISIAPALCCCTARIFASSPDAAPVKKSCCHCPSDTSKPKPDAPKTPEPCKCKAMKHLVAGSEDETTTLSLSKIGQWLSILDFSLQVTTFSNSVTVSPEPQFANKPAVVSGLTTSTQTAVLARLAC